MVDVIYEIGINHNGNLKKAVDMMYVAKVAGAKYIKFQKRDPDLCVPDNKKNNIKIVPWRKEETTYLQYKKDIEFTGSEYFELKGVAADLGLEMFSSAWDTSSVNFLMEFDEIVKVPSAKITDIELLKECRKCFDFRMMSTGMSTEDEIKEAVAILDPHVIFHTNSNYPTDIKDLNLGYLTWLKNKYPEKIIGYSSHFFGITDVIPAITLGATVIEKHGCLSHDEWGSDQSSSVEPHGFIKMVKMINEMTEGISNGNCARSLYPGEDKKRESLRG